MVELDAALAVVLVLPRSVHGGGRLHGGQKGLQGGLLSGGELEHRAQALGHVLAHMGAMMLLAAPLPAHLAVVALAVVEDDDALLHAGGRGCVGVGGEGRAQRNGERGGAPDKCDPKRAHAVAPLMIGDGEAWSGNVSAECRATLRFPPEA